MEKKKPSAIGSGVYNYDIIVKREYPQGFVVGKRNPFVENTIIEEVGGTCGNVMCVLGYLGWNVYPQAHFDLSEQGYKLKRDLESFGCDTRYVENSEKGGTTLLRCTHKLDQMTGEHVATFRATSPSSMFPKRKQLRVRDEVEPFVNSLVEKPDVYFFDAPEAGPRALAKLLREKGALVYFEPESDHEKAKFDDGVRVSDIIKFSHEKITDKDFCKAYRDKLFIQTLGADGLAFSLCGSEWVKVPAVPIDHIVDTEGCGDTTTAAFLDSLTKMDALSIQAMSIEKVTKALEEASQKAALCAQSMGSKGWIRR